MRRVSGGWTNAAREWFNAALAEEEMGTRGGARDGRLSRKSAVGFVAVSQFGNPRPFAKLAGRPRLVILFEKKASAVDRKIRKSSLFFSRRAGSQTFFGSFADFHRVRNRTELSQRDNS